MYFCSYCLSLLESLQHTKARHVVLTTQLELTGTTYKVRVATKICSCLGKPDMAIEVLLLVLICHIREEFFDGSRQLSFES